MDFSFLNKYDIIFAHLSRQIWKNYTYPIEIKNNHLVIQAFAKFVRKVNKNAVLAMINFGTDVNSSKLILTNFSPASNIFSICDSLIVAPVCPISIF